MSTVTASAGTPVERSVTGPVTRDVVGDIRITTGVLAAATAMILLYALLTPEGPNRVALRIAVATALVLLSGLWLFSTPRIAQAARQGVGGLVGLLTACGFVTIWVALDGGTSSPINAVYVVPLTVAVLQAPTAAYLIGGLVIGAHLLASLFAGAFDIATAIVWVTQLGLMTTVTAWIANARARQRERLRSLTEQLEDLAVRDPLTRVMNRRGFEASLVELPVGSEYGTPTALLVIDLDNFKAVNDRHGHAAGDQVLIAAAQAIRDAVRQGDVIARTGGEEFAVALLDADPATAENVAERIRRSIASCSATPPITASIGVAHADGTPGVAALHLTADRAMYEAKARGRDQVVIGDDTLAGHRQPSSS